MTERETYLQSQLARLRARLLIMCALAEEAVAGARAALENNDAELAGAVIAADSGIDELENEIDETALALLARAQPVARDLRFAVGALHLAVDLERVGDEAAGIAERVLLLRDAPRPPAFSLLRQMMELAETALRGAIDAFREENVPLALQVCRGQADILQLEMRLLQKTAQSLGAAGAADGKGCPALHAILIARSISRIFGRASNIAEHCYFMKQGFSIKHRKGGESG